MLRVGYPEQRAITPIRAHEGRRVSLDIGPFADQMELLQFAMELESMPGVSGLELLDAEPATALFVVYTRSASEFATLLTRMPDYRISSTALGNMVSARLEDADRMAAFMLLPAAGAGGWAGTRLRWWGRLVGAVAAGAAAAGVLYFAFSGTSQPATTPASTTRTVSTVAATTAPSVLPAATAAPIVSATAVASPTAAPTGTPAVPSATPSATAIPALVVATRYAGPFSAGLGTVVALNGCVWDVSLNGNLSASLTPQGGGSFSGPASMTGTIDYQVKNTPAGATCNAASTDVTASGTASGADTITASLSGARELAITFTGSKQGSSLVGNVSLQRAIGTVSSAGNTTETRSASASGVTLSAN